MSKKLQLVVVDSVDDGECDWTIYYGEPLTYADGKKLILNQVRENYSADETDVFDLGEVWVNDIEVDGYKIIMEKIHE